MNLIYRKTNLELNGNILSGNTYPVRDFIKSHLDGKWNSTGKTWTVNVDKVNAWIERGLIAVDNTPAVSTDKVRNGWNGWCDKCHSYCYGDCTAH